jgi:hypothetical protein
MKPKNADIAEAMARLFGEISRGKNETWGVQDLVPEALSTSHLILSNANPLKTGFYKF